MCLLSRYTGARGVIVKDSHTIKYYPTEFELSSMGTMWGKHARNKLGLITLVDQY